MDFRVLAYQMNCPNMSYGGTWILLITLQKASELICLQFGRLASPWKSSCACKFHPLWPNGGKNYSYFGFPIIVNREHTASFYTEPLRTRIYRLTQILGLMCSPNIHTCDFNITSMFLFSSVKRQNVRCFRYYCIISISSLP